MSWNRSEKIQEEVDKLVEELGDWEGIDELAASNCTSGYDNDGSTGLNIFKNGFQLGLAAAKDKKEVYIAETDTNAFFFLGTESEILASFATLRKSSASGGRI